ncbi:MAG: leucine-rich repeat protein [Oscillospiraceae bacterium]
MMKKLIRGLGALALCVCLSLGMAVSAHAVSNVPSSWAAEDVQTSIGAGIVPAALQGDYTASITRAEFCSLAAAVYETVTGTEITGRMTFTDTNDVHVEKMAYLGVVNGVGGGRFDPDGTLTREQAAAIIDRLAQAMDRPLADSAADFSDNGSISGWARASVGRVQAAGIMNGTGGSRFSPAGAYTREQSIVTMLRTMDAVENGPKVTTVAGGSCGDSVTWTLDSAGTLTISGTGEMKYYSPTKTPWYSLRGRIKSAVVEEGVTKLASSALSGCTGVTSVTLPESLTKINAYAFSGCTALTGIQVSDGNRAYCSVDGVLFNKERTLLICYPAGKTAAGYVIPDGVETVGERAFAGNSFLTSVTIPATVTEIRNYAFDDCTGLTDLYFLGSGGQFFDAVGARYGVVKNNGLQYLKGLELHFSVQQGQLDFTLNSLDEVEQVAQALSTVWPSYLTFRVPAARTGEYQEAIRACLEARFNSNSSYFNLIVWDAEEAILVCRVSYANGLEVIPYRQGVSAGLDGQSAQVLQKAEEILGGIITENMSEYEKVKAIHDYLVNHTRYQYSLAGISAAHAILNGTAICEGYSNAFLLLCELSDIDCLFVSGTAGGGHAWNKVRVDGVWYNVDVTWDDPTGGADTLRYDYFLISDAALSKDHTWDRDWLPASETDYPAGHGTEQGSASGNTSGNTSGSNAGNTPEDTSGTTEYTGGYWDTYVDQYGFTWVEVEDAHWRLYINGRQYGQDIYESAQAEMAGFHTLEQYIEGYGFKHYEEHGPSEQTAEDIAPRERGW